MASSCSPWRKSFCTPTPTFPPGCLRKAMEAIAVGVAAVLVIFAGCLVCTWKHKCHMMTLIVTLLIVAALLILGVKMNSQITAACFAVGVIDTQGYHLPQSSSDSPALLAGSSNPNAVDLLDVGSIGSALVHVCFCKEGECALNGECVRTGDCPKYTGGSCKMFGCGASRNAQCVNGACECRQDQCAVQGGCVDNTNFLMTNMNASAAIWDTQELFETVPLPKGYALCLATLVALLALTTMAVVITKIINLTSMHLGPLHQPMLQ